VYQTGVVKANPKGQKSCAKLGFMRKFQDILSRMLAVFTVGALGTLGAGAVIGIDTWMALSMAGLLAVASVAERLAREYLDDGKLTLDEINGAFSPFAKSEEATLPSDDEEDKSKSKRQK
jgi:hypothetical protein